MPIQVAACVSAYAGQAEATRTHLSKFHLNRIRHYALAHLGDCGLSVAQVGAALSLSASHIHRLFEAQELSFSSWLWECRLLASRNATPEDFLTVFGAIRDGRVPTDALVTHRATLEQAPERFPYWITPAAGVIKAIIEI